MSGDLEPHRGVGRVSLIFACGTALLADGYANGIIGQVKTLLVRIYGNAINDHNRSTILTCVTFAGTIVGMILFGWITDKFGRKAGMMSASAIVAVFSAISSASVGAHGSLDGLLSMLIACRFLLGIGIGAEYPCGAVAASEQAEEDGINKNARHRWLALSTNTMITNGFILAAFVPLVLIWICGEDHLRAVWRLSLGLGTVPAVAVFLWRLRMHEPRRYTQDSMSRTKIPYNLVIRRYWRSLAAVSATWFIFDFIAYPFNLFSSTVINNITGGDTSLITIFGWNVVINLFHTPGTVSGAFMVDRIGAKRTMFYALLAQAVVGFIMSGLYGTLSKHIAAFTIIYGLFLSLQDVGPGNCTIILAAHSSSTAVRGQYYGMAAAAGKVGALIGTLVFPPMIDAFGGPNTIRGNTGPFWVASGLVVLNAIITYFFVVPLSREGMIKEDMEFREYLEQHGYDTSRMGTLDDTSSKGSLSDEKEKDFGALEGVTTEVNPV